MSKKMDNQKNQRIQVFARCRPLNSIEKKQFSPSVVEVIPEKKEIVLKDRNTNREFFFDKVFPPDTKQISVYKSVVEPLVKEVLMGYNCTVFAYGQTGTGKTYTMGGERNTTQCSWEEDPDAGIVPRSLHQLFEELNKEENVEFSVRVSYLELYNEELYDLLGSVELSKLRLYEDTNRKGSVIIQGLEEIVVNNKDEVYAILEKGTCRRQTAATMLNATSSRSHTVFSVTVHIKENTIEGEELLKIGKLNLVDLAGSENVGRSGSLDKRAREAGNINQSLLTLGRVITALIEKQPHVPYRESKLTRILQDSLGGHTKTSIIATISPALCNFDETCSTLDYATKAKSITIKPEINQRMTKRTLIREYTEEIERLQKDLVAVRSKAGFFIDSENYTSMLHQINEKSEKIRELTCKIEELTEENIQIEMLFSDTKEELSKTNERLSETVQKCKQTENELSNKSVALAYTQEVLTKTTLERDEKEYLINIQKNTEKKLSNQAQALLQVADQTTEDVEGLHAKLERKQHVEQTNEERCQDFRRMYQRQFAKLDDMVTEAKIEHVKHLHIMKDDLDGLFSGLRQYTEETSTCFRTILSHEKSKFNELSSHLNEATSSQMQWSQSLLHDLNSRKDNIISELDAFVNGKLQSLFTQLNERTTEMENWILSKNYDLCQKIEQQRKDLEAESARKKELLCGIGKTLDSYYKHHEASIEDLRTQTHCLFTQQTELKEAFDGIAASFNKFAQHQKEANKTVTKLEGSCMELQNNFAELKNIEGPFSVLQTKETEFVAGLSAFSDISGTIKIEELSSKKEAVFQSQNLVASKVSGHLEHVQKIETENFNRCKTALETHNSTLSANIMVTESKIHDMAALLANTLDKSKKDLEEHNKSLHVIVTHSNSAVAESERLLNDRTLQIKAEILQRNLEFEKFVSEDLVKTIPTGTTPQRKTYAYSKSLAATSPHDRILQRFRSQMAADTAVAVNLPLDISFNENEELKSPPAEDTWNADTNSCNAPDATDSYNSTNYESNSNAYSVSDISVESNQNKENHKLSNKSSRLPKREQKFKGFAKTVPPPIRKPLVSTNSDTNSVC